MLSSITGILKSIFKHPLTKKHRFLALFGFIKFQILMMLTKNRFLVKWVDESQIIIRKGEHGLTGNLYFGLMDFQAMCFLLHYLRPSDDFYDIGSNVGAYTLLASKVVGARSFSYEPLPDTFDRFIEQININCISELVFAKNIAIAEKKGVLEFTNNMNCMNHVNTDSSNKNITPVEATTLDIEHINPQSCLVKIDIEGYELNAIAGGERFFKSSSVAAVITGGANEQQKLIDLGFFPVYYDPMSRTITKPDTYNTGDDTIYIKDLKDAQERCKTAKRFVVHTANSIII